ncbi:hypothetical protein KC343_g53 [Hortaea werneckii]|nr:hypothetical protein KC317_g52 [Hortaea werneckii]KAI7628659.1 hypothetical protein KC346_g56 [Hortaea werneckii]KAI7638497.1 hypothetical protein KC343_g53 [Hortaea werneckii]
MLSLSKVGRHSAIWLSSFVRRAVKSFAALLTRSSLPGNLGSSRKTGGRAGRATGRLTLKNGRLTRNTSSTGSGFSHFFSGFSQSSGRSWRTISQVATPLGSLRGLLNHVGRGSGGKGKDEGGV